MAQSVSPVLAGVRNVALTVAAGCLCYGGYIYLVRFGNLDPFKGLKRTNPLGSAALRIEKVKVHAYNKGKLQLSADLDKMDVATDKNSFDLQGVRNGLYYGDGRKVSFAGQQGNWNGSTQKLTLFGGVRAASTDFDLQTSAADFERKPEKLQVPLPVSGRFYGGFIEAANLNYDMRTKDLRTGPIDWQGKPEGVGQETGETVTPRTWTIKSGPFSQHGITQTFEDARATDGEVLVFAPHVERDTKTDVLTATGRVTYFSGKSDVIADKVVIYRKEKRAVFTGHVDMLVKPKKDQDQPPKEEKVPTVTREDQEVKPDLTPRKVDEASKQKDDDLRSGKTLRDYPLSITADEITYWYKKGNRHAVIKGAPVSDQHFPDGRWRKGWAHDALYDGEKDTLLLQSLEGEKDARMRNSIGDLYKGTWLEVSTKDDQPEGEEEVKGEGVEAFLVDRSGEDTREPKKPGAGSATPPVDTPGTVPKSPAPGPGTGTGTTG
jgi:lipopolysaccharide export system protein LptA